MNKDNVIDLNKRSRIQLMLRLPLFVWDVFKFNCGNPDFKKAIIRTWHSSVIYIKISWKK